MKEISGKAIMIGYDYTVRLTVDTALFPAGAALTAQIRASEDSEIILATLTSGANELLRVSDTVIDISIPGTKSATWTAGRVLMDIVNTTPNPDQYVGLKLTFIVEKPITRGL